MPGSKDELLLPPCGGGSDGTLSRSLQRPPKRPFQEGAIAGQGPWAALFGLAQEPLLGANNSLRVPLPEWGLGLPIV